MMVGRPARVVADDNEYILAIVTDKLALAHHKGGQ